MQNQPTYMIRFNRAKHPTKFQRVLKKIVQTPGMRHNTAESVAASEDCSTTVANFALQAAQLIAKTSA